MKFPVKLTRGFVTYVDAVDFFNLAKHKWYARECGRQVYAARRVIDADGKSRILYMHRQLTGALTGQVVDHIDHNSLNNSRTNLRLADKRFNTTNRKKNHLNATSKYKGVYWNSTAKRWHASLTSNNKRVHLGMYKVEIEAARAYDAGALKHFGEFACFNFPAQVVA